MTSIGTIILAVLVFGLIIIVHETGHLVVAKWAGVLVHEFTIGFGPALFKWKKGETLYAVRLIPLGGAVVMESGGYKDAYGNTVDSPNGRNDSLTFVDDNPRSFNNTPLFKRILIVLAGPVMNFVLAFIILILLLIPTKQVVIPKISDFMEGFPLQSEEGFQVGDTIKRINGTKISVMGDVNYALYMGQGSDYDILVERNGEMIELNDLPLELREYEYQGATSLKYGFIFSTKDLTPLSRLSYACKNEAYYARLIWNSVIDLIRGRVPVSELSGPVGISTAISETAKTSLLDMWYLVAFISINLGVVNLLPIPALDGGRLLFLLIELIRGKPVNQKYESFVHLVGLILFVLLFLYITYQDIVRQFFS